MCASLQTDLILYLCFLAAISHFHVVMAVRAAVAFLLLSALCLCIRHVHKKTCERPVTVKEGKSIISVVASAAIVFFFLALCLGILLLARSKCQHVRG